MKKALSIMYIIFLVFIAMSIKQAIDNGHVSISYIVVTVLWVALGLIATVYVYVAAKE